jgi:hypothetical protein
LQSSRYLSAGPIGAVRRLRRGLRDVRDRTARRSQRWRAMFAGMAGGDGIPLVLISHEGVDQLEVLNVLRRRWPDLGDDSRRCCRSRTMPPRSGAAADRDHAAARSAGDHGAHRGNACSRLIGVCRGGARRAAADRCRSWRICLPPVRPARPPASVGGCTHPTCSEIPLADRR